MGQRFRVHDLRSRESGAAVDDVLGYLRTVYRSLHSFEHAETRVYTCRSWRATAGATAPYELQWNDKAVPGETFLGSFGWVPGKDLAQRIEAELAQGESVRLFVFNSDADLAFEEVLVPLPEA